MTTPDFDGPGTGSVIVRVQDGDTTRQIGRELTEQGVVAGATAFIEAAEADGDRARSIQPGYYQLRVADVRRGGRGAAAGPGRPGSVSWRSAAACSSTTPAPRTARWPPAC